MTDDDLAALGGQLAERVEAALPAWVTRSVAGVLDALAAAGGELAASSGGPGAVLARATLLGRRVATEVGDELRDLARRDVDDMRTTPLALVRRAVAVPTAVLAEAGVPPVVRDRFAQERFPRDAYGLTPGSLAALDPELAALAGAWGAAKAAAHRARHGSARDDS